MKLLLMQELNKVLDNVNNALEHYCEDKTEENMIEPTLTIKEIIENYEPFEQWFVTVYNDNDNHFYITNEKENVILRTTQHTNDTGDYFYEIAHLASAAPSMAYYLKQYMELLKQANEILDKCWDSLLDMPNLAGEIETISSKIIEVFEPFNYHGSA